jgi:hypothetical protein
VHLSAADLIGFLEGSVDARAVERTERHLQECPRCREKERELGRLIRSMAADRLLEPSDAAMEAVIRRFGRSRRESPLPDWARGLRETVARLVFDTLRQPDLAFAGARTGAGARRLRFEAGDLELDVLIEPEGGRRRLTAQLLALGVGGSPISDANYLVSVAGHLETTGETDEHGELASDLRTAGEIEIHVAAHRTLALFRIPDRPGHPAGN